MPATIRALTIGSDGGRSGILSTTDLEIVLAFSCIVAMKRLQYGRVDSVVATDMPVGQVVSMLRKNQPAIPVDFVSDNMENSGLIDVLDAGPETVVTDGGAETGRERIRVVITSKRLNRAIEENERLNGAIREIATVTATLTDRVDIEEAIYDVIMNADLYELLRVGDFEEGSIGIRSLIESDFDSEEIVSLIGGDESNIIDRATRMAPSRRFTGRLEPDRRPPTTSESASFKLRRSPLSVRPCSRRWPVLPCR